MPSSLRPHGWQHAWRPRPSTNPRVYSNSCPLRQWSHPTISYSDIPFSTPLQSSQESGAVLYIRWLTYWSFNFNTSPSSEYSWLMSFRMDLCDLLAVQRIVKSLLQPHSSNISILWHSAVFTVQLSHPHVTTGETIACSRWTFIGKVCLCFLICCLG